MKTLNLLQPDTKWDHIELVFRKECYHNMVSNSIFNLFSNNGRPLRGYFNREGEGAEQRLRIHVNSAESDLLERVSNELQQQGYLEEGTKPYRILYNVNNDIAELISGVTAESLYLEYSLQTMRFLFEWIDSIVKHGNSKITLAFDLMVMHILNANTRSVYELSNKNPQYPASFLCYRSHADGFFVRTKQEKLIKKEMDSRYSVQKDIFHKRYETIKNHFYGNHLNINLSKWESFSNSMFSMIETEVEQERVSFVDFLSGEMGDFYQIAPENIHAKMQGSGLIQSYVSKNKKFQAVRLMSGLLYLTLHRLGLTLSERYYLCHLISRTIEDSHMITTDIALKNLHQSLMKKKIKRIMSLGLCS